jgi:hypothetical protein
VSVVVVLGIVVVGLRVKLVRQLPRPLFLLISYQLLRPRVLLLGRLSLVVLLRWVMGLEVRLVEMLIRVVLLLDLGLPRWLKVLMRLVMVLRRTSSIHLGVV